MPEEPVETISLRQLRIISRQGDTDVVPMPQSRIVPTSWTANLVQIGPPGPGLGRRHAIEQVTITLGRDSQCSLQIADGSVSRMHAHIEPRADGGYRLSDLNSRNGTYVNGSRVSSSDLNDGDYVQLGECVFRFLTGGNVEASYHDEIHRLTMLDPLTGVHNRRSLDEFLQRAIEQANRRSLPLAVLILDVDHFKKVNDRHGHMVGDSVLRGLAERLQHLARAEDLVARYGGEEFALVLHGTDLTGAVAAGERYRRIVADSPFCEGVAIPMTVSVGAAALDPGESKLADDLFQQADEQLYEAKRAGRNRVRPAPPAQKTNISAASDTPAPTGITREIEL